MLLQRLTWAWTASIVALPWDAHARERIRCHTTLVWLGKTGRQSADRLSAGFLQHDDLHRPCL